MSRALPRKYTQTYILLSLWNLYTYIYCMLTSQALVEMSIFGGALYMSARVSAVFFQTYTGDARYRLPERERRWRTAILALLLLMSFSVFVIYPSRLDNPSLWMLFALVICLTVRDSFTNRLLQRGMLTKPRRRSAAAYALLHIIPIAVVFTVYLSQLSWDHAWPLCLGYLLSELLSLLGQRQITADIRAGMDAQPTREQVDKLQKTLASVSMYRAFNVITQLVILAMELTTVVLYTRVAADSTQTLNRIAVATLVSLVFSAAADRWFNRRQRHQTSDPVNLMLVGLFLWLFGLSLLRRAHEPIPLATMLIGLGQCTAGSTLCLKSLDRLEAAMARVVRFAAGKDPSGYAELRSASQEWAQLLGEMTALAAMTNLCLRNPSNALVLTDINTPILVIAPLLAVLAALLLTFRFPLSNRIIDKVSWLLRLQEDGDSNPALEHQLKGMVIQKYARPVFINAGKAFFRIFYRHRLIGTERIRRDDNNPIVFLCNHGYINGPLVAMANLPVLARPWVIDKMTVDEDAGAKYLYENDISKNRCIPRPLRFPFARLLSRFSVWGMAQMEPIPVYRDNPGQLIRTFRASVEALQSGDNLLIFPENPNAIAQGHGYEVEGLGPLFSGFAMLAPIYYKRTGKCCRFLPMYVCKETHVVVFGEEILYDPDHPDDEVKRISAETERQMLKLWHEAAAERPGR